MVILDIEVSSNELRDFVDAIQRRSKALRHKMRSVVVRLSIDECHDDEFEVIELALERRKTRVGAKIRIKMWSDRWLWIDAREPCKGGWKWSYTLDGRLAGGKTGQNLLIAIESFIDSLPDVETGARTNPLDILGPLLLTGPQRLVH